MEKCITNGGGDEALGSSDLLEQQKIIMWETLAQHTTPEIQRVVEFAKRIPGFTELLQDDQLTLIKTGFFEVWLVRLARMFNTQTWTVTLSDGQYLVKDQMDIIYNVSPSVYHQFIISLSVYQSSVYHQFINLILMIFFKFLHFFPLDEFQFYSN